MRINVQEVKAENDLLINTLLLELRCCFVVRRKRVCRLDVFCSDLLLKRLQLLLSFL